MIVVHHSLAAGPSILLGFPAGLLHLSWERQSEAKIFQDLQHDSKEIRAHNTNLLNGSLMCSRRAPTRGGLQE